MISDMTKDKTMKNQKRWKTPENVIPCDRLMNRDERSKDYKMSLRPRTEKLYPRQRRQKMLSHKVSRHHNNGSDRGLSPWSHISPFKLFPYSRLRGGRPYGKMGWRRTRWEPTGSGDRVKQSSTWLRFSKTYRIWLDFRRLIPMPYGVNNLAREIETK